MTNESTDTYLGFFNKESIKKWTKRAGIIAIGLLGLSLIV